MRRIAPLLLVPVLIAAGALLSCSGSHGGIEQYMKTLTRLSSFYAPLSPRVAAQGFFTEAMYAELEKTLRADPKFTADLARLAVLPDAWFRSFHDYTLAYSCRTFRLALGDKSPDDYRADLDVTRRKLTEASRQKGITAERRDEIKSRVAAADLLRKRLGEYEKALKLVDPSILREVEMHLPQMDALYRGVFATGR